jgi:hypothetical protein
MAKRKQSGAIAPAGKAEALDRDPAIIDYRAAFARLFPLGRWPLITPPSGRSGDLTEYAVDLFIHHMIAGDAGYGRLRSTMDPREARHFARRGVYLATVRAALEIDHLAARAAKAAALEADDKALTKAIDAAGEAQRIYVHRARPAELVAPPPERGARRVAYPAGGTGMTAADLGALARAEAELDERGDELERAARTFISVLKRERDLRRAEIGRISLPHGKALMVTQAFLESLCETWRDLTGSEPSAAAKRAGGGSGKPAKGGFVVFAEWVHVSLASPPDQQREAAKDPARKFEHEARAAVGRWKARISRGEIQPVLEAARERMLPGETARSDFEEPQLLADAGEAGVNWTEIVERLNAEHRARYSWRRWLPDVETALRAIVNGRDEGIRLVTILRLERLRADPEFARALGVGCRLWAERWRAPGGSGI